MSLLIWIYLLCVYLCCVCAQDYYSNKVETSSEEISNSILNHNETSVYAKSNKNVINSSFPDQECTGNVKPLAEYDYHSCKTHKDCKYFGINLKCCSGKCSKTVQINRHELKHSPLFGIIERKCPLEPIAEILAVQECKSDADCGSRICCLELDSQGGGNVSYCRTPMYLLDKIPIAKSLLQPIQNVVSFMQCTPAPPPFLDLFPKPCRTPLDCIPNLCCQERGRRVCRPPRRSLLALILSMTQQFGFLKDVLRFP